MFDAEIYEERAAIMEYDGGLSRFEAETFAAKAQGLTRWQANADSKRYSEAAQHHRKTDAWQRTDNMPTM